MLPEAPGRLENLKELVRALADFETLDGFLDHVSLVMENEEAAAGDRVSLLVPAPQDAQLPHPDGAPRGHGGGDHAARHKASSA